MEPFFSPYAVLASFPRGDFVFAAFSEKKGFEEGASFQKIYKYV
jgi:hypothetical protein